MPRTPKVPDKDKILDHVIKHEQLADKLPVTSTSMLRGQMLSTIQSWVSMAAQAGVVEDEIWDAVHAQIIYESRYHGYGMRRRPTS